MKTEELMIGNFIEHITGIIVVDCDDFELIKNDPCEYMPIPLIEQWLIDFGFKKEHKYVLGVGNYYKMVKGELILLKNNDGNYYAVTCPFKPTLKSVHQLQNLYFSLSGEELIKTNAKL